MYVFTDRQGNIVYPEAEYQKIYDQCGFTITDMDGFNSRLDERLNELGMTKEELNNTFTEQSVAPDWVIWDEFE